MFDDDNDQYGFWRDEPTRPLERLAARRKPAGPAPMAPTRRPRPTAPQVGSRQHTDTQQVPVISSVTEGVRQATGHVDPLLRRMGVLAIAVALCVPVAMTLRSGDERSALQPQSSTVATGGATAAATDTATDAAVIEATPGQAPADEASATQQAATQQVAAQPAATAADGAQPSATVAATPAAGATVSNTISSAPPVAAPNALEAAAPAATAPVCAKKYEVVAGDYWILIAKKVSVSLNEVLAANNATTGTALYPGRTVCLPAGPSAPTTAAPATTAAPPTTAKATAATTATTVKPSATSTPAAAAPKASYTRAEVEAIIRQVWPDDLENEAVRIATRESNLIPGVRNYCCFGLFQLYYNVHKSWLAQMGVTSAEQLYDPLINSYVAYAMYLKAGGWGPWKL